ncbi:MAG TPA: class I SAM-dependent methyltransferase [Desulfuromonadaceae bacterium]
MNQSPSPYIPHLRGPVPLSHLLLRQFVKPGDAVVDATCGNGNDTLLLAELVGSTGRVWAFDIQSDAIRQAAGRLAESGYGERVEFVPAGHETMAAPVAPGLAAVVFNLGYLPGGDRTIITRPETTLAACGQALNLLKPGGILAVTAYPGHEGGERERAAVDAWAADLDPRSFHSWRMGQANVPPTAPYLILIQKAV